MTSEDDSARVAARFGAIARRYCALVDAATTVEKTELLLGLYDILPELVLEATRLPDMDDDGGDEEDVPPIPSAQE